jgi:alpha-D-ribose 1-methylphosphonate 5-triphosphate diphosphatase
MRALDGAGHRVIDILCSDYHPGTLLPALFRIAEESSWSLPEAVALATSNPAQAVALNDRGTIEVGKRADLIAVRQVDTYPEVVGLWVNGRLTWNKGIKA